ncbi:hypothetical protein Tco_0807385 [Tanacetum coccineum]
MAKNLQTGKGEESELRMDTQDSKTTSDTENDDEANTDNNKVEGLMTSNNVYFIASYIPYSKRNAFWSLNEDILKITILKTNTPYPSRKIRRDLDNSTSNVRIPLDSWTSGLLVYKLPLSVYFRMDDPNMTMEEYIKLEEEKAHRLGRVFNWQTATYGKIKVDDDLHGLRSVEAEFPAIVINNAFAPQDALPCKSQVSTPVNDEIYFRISFDESDDEDYTIICDKNSFSYKMIYVNYLKTDSENDNEKVVPSIPSPEPAISCFGDLDFFKDFENEFLAIVYNDAQTSKSDLLTELTLNP